MVTSSWAALLRPQRPGRGPKSSPVEVPCILGQLSANCQQFVWYAKDSNCTGPVAAGPRASRVLKGESMSDASRELERTTMRDRAESSLRELIVGGDLKPGERVNEVAVSTQLGISRGPLREAIQGLVREGLLEIVTHRGAFVRTVDAAMLRDLYEVRAALETYAVKLLAGLPRSAAVATLSHLVDEAETGLEDGYPNDADFHRGLFAAVGNPALASSAEDVQVRISLARARSARDPQRAAEALEEHRAILGAVGDGRVEEAVRLTERHLWSSYEHALKALDR